MKRLATSSRVATLNSIFKSHPGSISAFKFVPKLSYFAKWQDETDLQLSLDSLLPLGPSLSSSDNVHQLPTNLCVSVLLTRDDLVDVLPDEGEILPRLRESDLERRERGGRGRVEERGRRGREREGEGEEGAELVGGDTDGGAEGGARKWQSQLDARSTST